MKQNLSRDETWRFSAERQTISGKTEYIKQRSESLRREMKYFTIVDLKKMVDIGTIGVKIYDKRPRRSIEKYHCIEVA